MKCFYMKYYKRNIFGCLLYEHQIICVYRYTCTCGGQGRHYVFTLIAFYLTF